MAGLIIGLVICLWVVVSALNPRVDAFLEGKENFEKKRVYTAFVLFLFLVSSLLVFFGFVSSSAIEEIDLGWTQSGALLTNMVFFFVYAARQFRSFE